MYRSVVLPDRIIWATLLTGQVAFAVVALLVTPASFPRPSPALVAAFPAINAGLLAVAYGIAAVISPRRIDADAIPDAVARAYRTANILRMAALEIASAAGLTVVMLTHSVLPLGVVPAVTFVAQLLQFPRDYMPVRP